MKVLLDTHIWLWWLLGSERLEHLEHRSLDRHSPQWCHPDLEHLRLKGLRLGHAEEIRQTDQISAVSRPSSYHYVVDEPLLRTIAAEIQAAIPGAQVRLFGSRACGTERPDSDLDLLVTVAAFPSPEELWARSFAEDNACRDRFAAIPYVDKGGSLQFRFYQDIAVSRALEAIGTGRNPLTPPLPSARPLCRAPSAVLQPT
ncbi:MAG: nucleotidyltransferase domain-containing protein [Cyanobacteria bacterium]|nr:nucleotidyltransferase domain-containing protein [Cyanobacteriota bacterium]